MVIQSTLNYEQYKKEFQQEYINGGARKENLKGFMDLANVFMVIPKYEELKTFITENFEVSETDKIPELDYNKENSGTSKYSSEYAKVLFSIAKNTNDNFFKISVAENYPLKVETNEYIFILAPRVEN